MAGIVYAHHRADTWQRWFSWYDCTGGGNVLSTALARTTTRFELSAPGNMETSIGEYKANVIHSP